MKARPQQTQKVKQTRKKKVTTKKPHQKRKRHHQQNKQRTARRNKRYRKWGKTLQNSTKTQTQKSARENMTKESMEQVQILETIDKKEENMKQVINPNNTQEYENIEEKKPVKDIKEQNTNNQQLPEVTITKQNDTNITTTSKEKTTTRSQITERRMAVAKRGQLKNNKYEDQKVQEQEREDKDSCPKCKKYVREGVKCRVCDRWIHYNKCEEIRQQQVEENIQTKFHTYAVWIGRGLRKK